MQRKYLLLAFVLTGCATRDRAPAVLELPISRLESPEPMAGRANFGFSYAEESYLVLSSDQTQAAPNTQNPSVGRCPGTGRSSFSNSDDEECAAPARFKADIQLAPGFELGARHTANGFTYPQAKLYLMPPRLRRPREGDSSAAITAAYGSDDPSYSATDANGNRYQSRFDRDMRDAALIVGERLTDDLLLFVGGYYSEHRYKGRYDVDFSNTSTPDTTMPFQGDAVIRGGNIGFKLDLTPNGKTTLIAECARARVNAGDTRSYVNRCAAGMEFAFGGGRSRDD